MTVLNSKGLMFATLFACAGSAYAPVGESTQGSFGRALSRIQDPVRMPMQSQVAECRGVIGTLCVVGGVVAADGAINRRGWFRKIHCKKCGLHLSGAEHDHTPARSWDRRRLWSSSSAPIDCGPGKTLQRDLPRQSGALEWGYNNYKAAIAANEAAADARMSRLADANEFENAFGRRMHDSAGYWLR